MLFDSRHFLVRAGTTAQGTNELDTTQLSFLPFTSKIEDANGKTLFNINTGYQVAVKVDAGGRSKQGKRVSLSLKTKDDRVIGSVFPESCETDNRGIAHFHISSPDQQHARISAKLADGPAIDMDVVFVSLGQVAFNDALRWIMEQCKSNSKLTSCFAEVSYLDEQPASAPSPNRPFGSAQPSWIEVDCKQINPLGVTASLISVVVNQIERISQNHRIIKPIRYRKQAEMIDFARQSNFDNIGLSEVSKNLGTWTKLQDNVGQPHIIVLNANYLSERSLASLLQAIVLLLGGTARVVVAGWQIPSMIGSHFRREANEIFSATFFENRRRFSETPQSNSQARQAAAMMLENTPEFRRLLAAEFTDKTSSSKTHSTSIRIELDRLAKQRESIMNELRSLSQTVPTKLKHQIQASIKQTTKQLTWIGNTLDQLWEQSDRGNSDIEICDDRIDEANEVLHRTYEKLDNESTVSWSSVARNSTENPEGNPNSFRLVSKITGRLVQTGRDIASLFGSSIALSRHDLNGNNDIEFAIRDQAISTEERVAARLQFKKARTDILKHLHETDYLHDVLKECLAHGDVKNALRFPAMIGERINEQVQSYRHAIEQLSLIRISVNDPEFSQRAELLEAQDKEIDRLKPLSRLVERLSEWLVTLYPTVGEAADKLLSETFSQFAEHNLRLLQDRDSLGALLFVNAVHSRLQASDVQVRRRGDGLSHFCFVCQEQVRPNLDPNNGNSIGSYSQDEIDATMSVEISTELNDRWFKTAAYKTFWSDERLAEPRNGAHEFRLLLGIGGTEAMEIDALRDRVQAYLAYAMSRERVTVSRLIREYKLLQHHLKKSSNEHVFEYTVAILWSLVVLCISEQSQGEIGFPDDFAKAIVGDLEKIADSSGARYASDLSPDRRQNMVLALVEVALVLQQWETANDLLALFKPAGSDTAGSGSSSNELVGQPGNFAELPYFYGTPDSRAEKYVELLRWFAKSGSSAYRESNTGTSDWDSECCRRLVDLVVSKKTSCASGLIGRIYCAR